MNTSLRLLAALSATLLATSLLLASPARAQEASFEGLGDLPGGAFSSSAGGVSADGSTVVGQSTSASGNEAFRWTASGGMVGLSDLPGGTFNSNARDVSADGNVVVGAGTSANGNEAFRWTQAGGMLGLGDLPGGDIGSRANSVSADGSVVVGGSGSANGNEAFRWTQAGGMQGLGDLPGGDISSEALAVSSDGSVVVGFGTNASDFEAFIWTAASGMQGLGDLPGGVDQSFAFGVSSDGSVVAGVGKSANGDEAFRWTAAGGMVGLGFLPGGFVSDAFGVSADGSVVVGDAQNAAFDLEAFVWTATDGMRSLRDVLVAQGVDMTGWTLPTANAVSADGRTVVGTGNNPQGQTEAWRAVLSGGHRWISPAGGSWDVAVNWSPATVPTQDDDVRFDLDATYTVTGAVPLGGTAGARGGRRVRRLAADDGLVDYDLADLTLTATTLSNPSLSVSFDARAKLISGTATAEDVIVGYGGSTDSTVVARLQVFNAGTTLDASGDLVVGLEGRGEVFVAAGHLNALNTSIGGDFDLPGTADGVGEVIVGNEGTLDTGGLSVGLDAAGTLTVEEGGAVTAQRVVVGGDNANVAGLVDMAGVAPSGARSRLFVTDTLFVNEAGGGELAVRDGGEVTATGVLVGGFDGSGFGLVTVSGVEAGERASLTANRLVVGEGNDGGLLVEDGGQVLVNDAVLGTAAGSALATVFGTAGGFRAELVATKTGFAGRCLIGDSDTSVLNIHTGGYVRCDQAEIGDTGSGLVEVGGTQTSDSLVVSRVLTLGDGAPGVLRLSPGAVVDGVDAPRNPPSDPADVVVEADGRIEGSGIVVGRVDNDGFVGPGVVVGPPAPLAESPASRGGGPSVGGTLLVEGAYEQQPGGLLDVALAGADSTLQGRLRVRPVAGQPALDGSAALGGTLRLAFLNAYAPNTGDTFTLLDATSTTGAFVATEVTGLEPGWQFEVDIENGTVVLTSLSDGVATTFPIPTEPGASELPAAFALGAPYPNPFNPTTVVPFEVAEDGRVRLSVYDLLGREVAVLFEGDRPAGRHEVVLDGAGLASGLYLVRMTAERGFAQTRRVTLLR